MFIELSDLLLSLEYKLPYLKVIGLENAIDNSFSTFSSGCFGGLYEKLNRFKYTKRREDLQICKLTSARPLPFYDPQPTNLIGV